MEQATPDIDAEAQTFEALAASVAAAHNWDGDLTTEDKMAEALANDGEPTFNSTLRHVIAKAATAAGGIRNLACVRIQDSYELDTDGRTTHALLGNIKRTNGQIERIKATETERPLGRPNTIQITANTTLGHKTEWWPEQ